ncbi:hypothetical protein [Burkholderia sp. S171]|uniref:hypothetical protein n=1 Tax=Burkholderia sp. S171 TaxID=1641860 RepID=UPI00131DB074|nr:hypothetical protein [Burkholderia sp. S171]
MPIDFARVPPKVAVPELPRLSLTVWAFLFVLVTSGGAGFAIYTLPPGTSSDTAWFWICVAVFPVLAWTFLLFARLTFLHVQRATAIATNRVSDRELDKCHARASEPLALIGHAWIFSGVDEENEASGITDGAVQLKPRASLASSNSDVTARWIDIPGRSFNAGNAFSERRRHIEIIEWLLECLITRLAPQLRRLPSSTSLRVTLSLSAHVDEKLVGQRLAIMLANLHLGIDVTVDATNEKVSLFEVDSWLDDINDRTVHLLVALQLRNAISNLLEKRMAEAAVALLVGHSSLAAVYADGSSVRVHRPERGPRETPDEILASAARWGRSAMSEIDTAWTCDVSPNSYLSIRSSKHFDPRTGLCDLNATIGDCGYANQWLTLALAARQSTDSGFPQSIIVQEGEELIALTCKKHT